MRCNGSWLSKNLSTFDLFTVNTTEQSTDVVTSLSEIKHLAEHLDARDNRLTRLVLQTNDLNRIVHLELTTLNAARCNRTTARDREDILDRHQERLSVVALRRRDVVINSFHELDDVLLLLFIAFEGLQSGTSDYRDVIAREIVAGEQLANFHLDELEELRIVNLVNLVEEDNDCRNTDLASEQDVLTRLRHRAISSGNDEDCTIHLSGARDHVLDIVSVARAVNVCIVTFRRLILNVCRVDRDTALTLLRSLIDISIIFERSFATRSLGENFRDCSRQRRLAMVNVTDGTDVNMRFGSFKLFFSHCDFFLPYSPLFFATILSAIFLGTSS